MNEESVRDYESEATEQGWNPDFDGPNKTDAKTFVEKGERIAGIANKKNKKLEHRIEHLEDANRKFGEYHKETIAQQQQKNAERVAELEAKVAQAITDGDGQEYTRANREIETLKSNTVAPTDDAQAWAVMTQEWIGDNKWYQDNPKLAAYADGVSDRIRAQGYTGNAYFSELTANVMETFPDEFEAPKKAAASAVESPGQLSTPVSSKDRTYDNLDPTSKAACDDFVKQGFMTQDDYLSTYEWE